MRRNVLAGVAALLALFGVPGGAAAKTFEVTRHNDPAPGKCKPDDCSLREAIRAANARDGKDAVLLPDRARYVLKRANATPLDEDESLRGDLDVTDKLTLRHAGRGKATIDAARIDRVLDVQAATVVKRIKLTGGANATNDPLRATTRRGVPGAGAGIIMHAPLTLSRSAVVGNEGANDGGGIEGFPFIAGDTIPLKLNRSKVAKNVTTGTALGGGIDTVDVRVTLARSKVVANEAGNAGGGVSLFGGELRMNRTTVAGNRAAAGVGGVYLTDADGTISNSTISSNVALGETAIGGIESNATLTVANSTVASNTAGNNTGGIQISGPNGDLRLRSATVVRNLADSNGAGGGTGGGVVQGAGATAALVNTIIALNRQGATPSDCQGGFATGGGNLIGTGDGCNLLGLPARPDLVGVNPKLGQLKRNGGPTQTVALKKGSPAIGKAVKAEAPSRDQRGVKRDNKPDIGAYER